MVIPLILVELVAATDSAGTTTTLRFSLQQEFITGASDTPAHTIFEPRIERIPRITRTLGALGTVAGPNTAGVGDLILSNADGGLNALIDYGFDGRSITIYAGPRTGSTFPADFEKIFTGTMQNASFTSTEVIIRIRDQLFKLDKPLQPKRYDGSNALPAGFEGVEGDIKDQVKPVTFGHVLNVTPPQVNTSRLIWQVSDRTILSVPAVYDQGLALSTGADYASVGEVQTAAPNTGAYRTWPGSAAGGAYFRLGGSPAGLVTCDVIEGAVASARTVGRIFNRILSQYASFAASSIGSTTISTMMLDNTDVVGVWVNSEVTILDVLNNVTGSVGASIYTSRNGVVHIAQVKAPTGTSVFTLREMKRATAASTEADLISVRRIPSRDPDRSVPAYRVNLNYQRNHSVQKSDIAGAVTDARRGFLVNQWRVVASTDNNVQTKHILSPEIFEDSHIVSAEPASVEVIRRLDLRKVRRDRLDVIIPFELGTASTIDLSDEIEVFTDRLGYSTGRSFVILGDTLVLDDDGGVINLDLWG